MHANCARADPRKDLERQTRSEDDDCFKTHCNPLCNEDSPRSTVPINPPSCIRSGGLQSPAIISPALTPPQFTRSPTAQHRRTVATAVNAETQTSLAKSTQSMAPPAVVSQQDLRHTTVPVAHGKNVGTGTAPRERPRTTSCHVLHASTTSLPSLSENCATMYESCLEPVSLQSSTDMSGSSSGLLLPADSQRIHLVRPFSSFFANYVIVVVVHICYLLLPYTCRTLLATGCGDAACRSKKACTVR